MEKSSIFIIAAIILSALTISFIPHSDQNTQGIYQTKLQFEIFKLKYGKIYTIQEEPYRFSVFKDNFQMIQKHNVDQAKTYKMGINHFADLTSQQFSSKILLPNLRYNKPSLQVIQTQASLKAPPASIDWRAKGVVTQVKNQGNCGSCWSFSTTGVLEGFVAMKTNVLNSYSQQQLVDCCAYGKYGCQGCSGAWPEWALQYVKDAGIVKESEYTYNAVADKCKPIPTAVKLLNTKKPWSQLSNTTDSVKSNLAELGPLSICVDAYKWQFYISGVFNDCHDVQIDHAVLLVGYQQDGTWIVKNSWSDQWGEKGYIRIANKGTSCLLKDHVIIPHLL